MPKKNKQKPKKSFGLLLLLALLATAGITYFLIQSPLKTWEQPNRPQSKPQADSAPEVNQLTVRLYFPNPEYIKTGNDKLAKLIKIERPLDSPENLVQTLLDELRKPPEGYQTALNDKLLILDSRLEGDIAYINFSSRNLYGGSLEELLLIKQIVNTLTEQPEINQVQFLVDGEKRETLMGHLDATIPFNRYSLK